LANEDFNDDKKDAGELGAGHTVTALYEIIPAGIKDTMIKNVDKLKYQSTKTLVYNNNELMNIKLRYKEPESEVSKLLTYPVINSEGDWQQASDNFKLSASVAEFGLLLRESSYKQNSSFGQILKNCEKCPRQR
jgi:Ca-activated chloride channel family protein